MYESSRFTRLGVKNPRGYSFGAQKIPEASSCKYLGIILRSVLNWMDQVNYTAQKAWKALHFVKRVLKKGNTNTKSLAYTSLVRPVLEYGSCMLGSMQRSIDKCVRTRTEERGSIYKSHEVF